MKSDEMEPVQIAVEVAGGDSAAGAEEILQARMPVVDGLDMEFPADTLAGRLIERLMADAQGGGARR